MAMAGLRASLFLAVAVSVAPSGSVTGAPSGSAIVKSRLTVDGAAFYPVGMYVHDLSAADWAWMKSAGINTVLTYTNGLTHVDYSPNATTLAATAVFLDQADDHGVKVFLSLKDLYPMAHKTMPDKDWDALVTTIVTAFKRHKALLGWYLNDEYHVDYIPALAARRTLVSTLDPDHVTYSVVNFLAIPGFSTETTRGKLRNLSLISIEN